MRSSIHRRELLRLATGSLLAALASGCGAGRPRCFVSHGRSDPVLPVERCSRRIVRELRDDRYDVRYTEFDGGHTVPPEIARAAVDWLLAPG